jgi:hypothetical protein
MTVYKKQIALGLFLIPFFCFLMISSSPLFSDCCPNSRIHVVPVQEFQKGAKAPVYWGIQELGRPLLDITHHRNVCMTGAYAMISQLGGWLPDL